MHNQSTEQYIKAVYDQRPYPEAEQSEIFRGHWSWVDLSWVESLLPQAVDCDRSFKRILIAGCGTGKEAFQMRNRFPDAEITAVDFSNEAITHAQANQQARSEYANIRFEVGNLTQNVGDWARADYYNFISCHGVMSYIPKTQDAFDTLTSCLAPNGVLYLGVNGATHIGIAIRQSIQHFGHASNAFEDTAESRQLIELFDRMRATQENISSCSAAYLASDILNTFSLNLPLADWLQYAQNSKLHFISSTELVLNLAKTLSADIFPQLIPKDRSEICEIIAYNNVAPFHRLVFCKAPQTIIPWSDFNELADWKYEATQFYSIEYPISTIDGEINLRAAISDEHEIHFSWPVDDIVARLLKPDMCRQRIGDVLKDITKAGADQQRVLTEKLFMLHQLSIIKILEPTI